MRAPAPPTRRRARMLAWSGLALLVATRVAIALLALEPRNELLISDGLTYLLPMALVIASSAFLTLRLRAGVEHRFWASVFIATSCLLISDSYFTWYSAYVDFKGPPLPSPMNFFSVLAAVFYGAIIVSMTRYGQRSMSARARLLLDVLAAMTIAYAAVYTFWTLPAFEGLENATVTAAWAAGWPVFGATILTAILAIMVGFKTHLWRPWERLVAAANALFAFGLLFFPVWYPALKRSDALEAGWYGLVLGAGLYLLFVASIYRVTASSEEALEEVWPTPRWRLQGVQRFYPVTATLALLVIASGAHGRSGSGTEGPLLGAAIVLAVLLAARSWLAALEVGHYRLTAVTDPLTGVYNRAYFLEQLHHSIGRDADSERILSLMLVGIDDFARVDRIHGREARDRSMRLCAAAIQAASGGRSAVFRLRTEEFAVLLPGTGADEALEVSRRIANRIATQLEGTVIDCSVSIGVASFPKHALEPESLLASARVALERARSEDGGPTRAFDSAGPSHPQSIAAQSGRALRDSLRGLAVAVDGRDPATRHHSSRVAELSRRLAHAAQLPEAKLRLVEQAALIHDIGKVVVSEQYLRTRDRLPREQAAVDEHAQMGESILVACGFPEMGTVVRHHHERWDGQGMPDGLSGPRIPIESRILAICNSFANLTAGGLAPNPVTADTALAAVTEGSGSLFDPELAALFREMLEPRARPRSEG